MALTFDEICIDARGATALGAWWAQVLGWPHDLDDDGDVRLHPPPGAGPDWIFIAAPDEKVANVVSRRAWNIQFATGNASFTPETMTELKALFIGDNYYASFPNMYTLRGT